MVDEKTTEPHLPVWDKTQRNDQTLSSSNFQWDAQADAYCCPQGQLLRKEERASKNLRTHGTKADTIIYASSQGRLRGLTDGGALVFEHTDAQDRS